MIRVPALAAALLCVTAATHASAAMTATPVLTGLTNLRDTAPDPRGRRLYCIADGSRGPAVSRLTLASGAPLVSPQGLAVGDDGGELPDLERLTISIASSGVSRPSDGASHGPPQSVWATRRTPGRSLPRTRRQGA